MLECCINIRRQHPGQPNEGQHLLHLAQREQDHREAQILGRKIQRKNN
jgi:hypothetical protein